MAELVDLEAIRRDHPLPAIVGGSLELQRTGREWKACCPFHEDRSPSFTIFDCGRRFHCFGCGASGDVLDYLQRAHGVGLREAAEMLGSGSLPRVDVVAGARDEKPERLAEAISIWRSASPAAGTPAEAYLRARGLHLPIPASIRFARLPYGRKGPLHPCLVACVASAGNQLTGIQRTYLNAAGTGKAAVPKPKLSLGRVSGGAIRCAPAALDLVVCEGLEDGLSLQQELGGAVWVAAGASMLPAMQFPAGVRAIVIGADGDAAGEVGGRKAAEAFSARGLSVRIMRPAAGFKDFNEQLAARPAGRDAA